MIAIVGWDGERWKVTGYYVAISDSGDIACSEARIHFVLEAQRQTSLIGIKSAAYHELGERGFHVPLVSIALTAPDTLAHPSGCLCPACRLRREILAPGN